MANDCRTCVLCVFVGLCDKRSRHQHKRKKVDCTCGKKFKTWPPPHPLLFTDKSQASHTKGSMSHFLMRCTCLHMSCCLCITTQPHHTPALVEAPWHHTAWAASCFMWWWLMVVDGGGEVLCQWRRGVACCVSAYCNSVSSGWHQRQLDDMTEWLKSCIKAFDPPEHAQPLPHPTCLARPQV